MNTRDTAIVAALLLAAMTNAAFAYVDPGSGSAIVTTVLGVIAAVGYTFRKYFYKARRAITGSSKDEDKNDD